ncbi:MBL fold metallo-hydrolase [Clostridium manihotivorum]|uniref:MBL fold metallo-hydrolase n=1 Tax=Clostridium manihotivorum TaxID=2320868 RepID=A0A3R5UGC3_9CLOT|nr:MBL fold metallo-hydrolase [Clostridium manihotivorum]QAA33097.1 MBL fold metallo-hydrolase [Clostridium manihotivorum]
MITEILNKVADLSSSSEQVTEDIIVARFKIVNAVLIGNVNNINKEWVLIDTGLESSAEEIIEIAEKYYGKGNKPKCIILTHGHFDHIGSVRYLSELWQVVVYAHKLEIPFLTGKEDYPKGDPSVDDGLVAKMSQYFPIQAIDLGDKVKILPEDGTVPNLSEWRWVHTPGHTPGHISLFRERDRALIVGDAFTTLKQESLSSVLIQNKDVNGPPAYLTTNWEDAKNSVKVLADLKPEIIIPSHGSPMSKKDIEPYLEELVKKFDEEVIPEQGKFVK